MEKILFYLISFLLGYASFFLFRVVKRLFEKTKGVLPEKRANSHFKPKDVTYVGWIEGKPEYIPMLRNLGVTGQMVYAPLNNAIEFCSCSDDVMQRLIKQWPGFHPGCFTAVDSNGNQLPREEQYYRYYAMPNDSVCECGRRGAVLRDRYYCGICWEGGAA